MKIMKKVMGWSKKLLLTEKSEKWTKCHCTWDTKDEKELAKQGITCHAEEIAAEKVDKMDETNIRTGVEKI